MGLHYQILVVDDGGDVAATERRIGDWLHSLVQRAVLSPGREGEYEAGPRVDAIQASPGVHPRGWLRVRRGDGARGRGVFGGGEGSFEGLRCPRCHHSVDVVDVRAWSDAVDRWWRGGDGSLTCGACGVATPVTDWPGDATIAYGHVAIELFQFAPVSDAFVDGLRAELGRDVRRAQGKI